MRTSTTTNPVRVEAVRRLVKPGRYLTVRLPTGAVRSYSLSSNTGYRISVKREPAGQVSGYLHETLRPGTILDVAAPRGDFVLDDDSRPVVLVSAGIGITPVLAMLHQLASQRSAREVWWLHAARRPMAFASEVGKLLDELPTCHARTYYSDDRLTVDALRTLSLPSDAVAYVCGPAVRASARPVSLPCLPVPSTIDPRRWSSRRPAPYWCAAHGRSPKPCSIFR